ncbi:hypothetical protein HCN44_000669 [Aphidius gifuensis]|uniref:Kelch repeat-containing protein n=1 Tax=Aphidius gifuensis TaxID=684658 RepID=A0A834XTA8_APHGI|nr:kelch domain-containing protein 4-like [Aphidius gifuensis]KAF7990864.1 hypothetical protein HCN44_000669 [Aphidius gifuensis]
MGKKNKNKEKISGSVKTAMKTEKKLSAKQKKELAAIGEDDIEKIVAQIEKDEAKRLKVVEAVIDQPSRRLNFTLSAHPFKDELIMIGGEFFDGQKTTVYGDMFFYNINKKTWTVMKAPGAPPPRCGHQTCTTSNNKGEIWVFGGEFTSPSQSQFYHYKDLWVYHIVDKKWEKITATGGPSARSGHRMVYGKKQLIVFGGFHDNLRDFKYYNDLHIFDMTEYKWNKIDLTGSIPAPRSGCIVLPMSDNKIMVYGGYSKERVKKDVDKGQIHTDMFVIAQDKHDKTGLKWKSLMVKQSGIKFPPRCSSSGILINQNFAYVFGGVCDDDDDNDDEELNGTFYNDLFALDMEKYQWKSINLSGKKDPSLKKRRRKQDDDDDDDDANDDEDNKEEMEITKTEPTVVTSDDGIFTVTLGPALSSTTNSIEEKKNNVFTPCPRISSGMVVKNNILYLYGGMYEDGDRQCTLNDFYSLDIHKLDEWQTITTDDLSSVTWLDSDSDDSGSDDSGDTDTDNDNDDEDKEDMEVDD